MTVEARWREREGRWEYHIPGLQGFVTPSRPRASIISSPEVMAREVKELASATGVRLPASWELDIHRGF